MTKIFATDKSVAPEVALQSEAVIADICATFIIIRPSRSDTVETIEQVQAHNRAWRSLCQ